MPVRRLKKRPSGPCGAPHQMAADQPAIADLALTAGGRPRFENQINPLQVRPPSRNEDRTRTPNPECPTAPLTPAPRGNNGFTPPQMSHGSKILPEASASVEWLIYQLRPCLKCAPPNRSLAEKDSALPRDRTPSHRLGAHTQRLASGKLAILGIRLRTAARLPHFPNAPLIAPASESALDLRFG